MSDTWYDRSEWGDGPWQDEPDRVEWRRGPYVCLLLRNELGGVWCGYLGVRRGHPWFGKDFDALDVNVHGGLTFCGPCMAHGSATDYEGNVKPDEQLICHVPNGEDGDDDRWWVGFDCHHGFDIGPAMDARMRKLDTAMGWPPLPRHDYPATYKTIGYARAEVEALAAQADAAT